MKERLRDIGGRMSICGVSQGARLIASVPRYEVD